MNPGGNPPAGYTPWMRVAGGELTIEVTARPGASRRGVTGVSGERLVIGVHSGPQKGKANDELIEYLAGELRVPRSAILIVRGATSRRKTIRIVTHDPAKVVSRLRQIGRPK
ncbi:MAG: DUF167 domain-containing protein [Candidatus Binatus sp.]|uniref:DUF167 domain-containing protein n=1 Tax=Candidatus Binatus sp. TaxID=2811406 RepID=UPI003D0FE2B0